MSRKSLDDNQPIILKCALLITAFTRREFSTRDVMFHVDLVKNLFRPSNHFADFNLQPLQIIRLFEKYASDDWAVVNSVGKSKTFSLTSLGYYEIIESLVKLEYILPTGEAIFLQWLLETYGNFVVRAVKDELGPTRLRHLKDYVSQNHVFKRQMELIELGEKDMKYRIQESRKFQAFLAICKGLNMNPSDAYVKLPSQYSYQLSHQKSFQNWLLDLPREIQDFEFEYGVGQRESFLYQKSLEALEASRAFYAEASQPRFRGGEISGSSPSGLDLQDA